MTNSEADNLIATLPKPGSLQLYRVGDWIIRGIGLLAADSRGRYIAVCDEKGES